MTSKSYRAVLPNLSEQELGRLRQWAADNCSASTVFREDHTIIWLASKDRARSREAFLRSVRNTLRQLGVDVTQLRGRWLILTDDCAVQPVVGDDTHAPAHTHVSRQEPLPELETGDIKVIPLGGLRGAPKRSRLHVVKE